MRIGLALYGDLDGQSGGFRYDRKLVEHLRAAGDSVTVIDLPWRSYPRGLLDNLSGTVRDRLAADVDILLQDELAHPSLVCANRAVTVPVVSVVHHLRASEGGRLRPLYRAVESRYLATVDAAICNSEATRTTVVKTGAIARERTVVAPPAGDRFNPSLDRTAIVERAREGPLSVVFVGNVEPRKGLDTLVGGLARVEDPWRLTVVGRAVDDDYLDRVVDYITTAGVADRVTFTGRLSDAALASVLRDSHLLAVPSRYEGFGIVYLEGMSFGLPALASTAGGASEVVTDGETGWLLDPDDPAAVADAVREVIGDRERLATMGRAARDRYERHPDWSTTAGRVRSFLGDLLDRADEPQAEAA